MLRLSRKAQSSLEYAVLIAIVAGGLIAMQVYVKRAFQGNMQSSADDMGEQFSIDALENLNYSYHTRGDSHETFTTGVTRSELIGAGETSESWSNVTIREFSEETWNASGEPQE